MQTLTPNGCKYCGIGQYMHFSRYVEAVGWHQYAAPSQRQILMRMRDRHWRNAKLPLAKLKETNPIRKDKEKLGWYAVCPKCIEKFTGYRTRKQAKDCLYEHLKLCIFRYF